MAKSSTKEWPKISYFVYSQLKPRKARGSPIFTLTNRNNSGVPTALIFFNSTKSRVHSHWFSKVQSAIQQNKGISLSCRDQKEIKPRLGGQDINTAEVFRPDK